MLATSNLTDKDGGGVATDLPDRSILPKDDRLEQEVAQIKRWLRDHVDPRLTAVDEWSLHAPVTDVSLAAVLDKLITPFVYWLREQPLGTAPKTSLPESVKPQAKSIPNPTDSIPMPGGSLSNWPPGPFLEQYGLSVDEHARALGMMKVYPNRYLGKDEFQAVTRQLKEWGYWSANAPGKDGKSIWWWEKREGT